MSSRLLNFAFYQTGWFCCVLGAANGNPVEGALVATALLLLHLALVTQPRREILLVLAAAVIGGVVDSLQSCLGLYGLMAHSVTRRTGEIGIRMALGATPGAVAWPILRSALCMVGVGIAIGLPLVFAIVRLVRGYLFGIQPYDPATVIGAAVLLFAVAASAAWVPSRRAARIDPMEALRYE